MVDYVSKLTPRRIAVICVAMNSMITIQMCACLVSLLLQLYLTMLPGVVLIVFLVIAVAHLRRMC